MQTPMIVDFGDGLNPNNLRKPRRIPKIVIFSETWYKPMANIDPEDRSLFGIILKMSNGWRRFHWCCNFGTPTISREWRRSRRSLHFSEAWRPLTRIDTTGGHRRCTSASRQPLAVTVDSKGCWPFVILTIFVCRVQSRKSLFFRNPNEIHRLT